MRTIDLGTAQLQSPGSAVKGGIVARFAGLRQVQQLAQRTGALQQRSLHGLGHAQQIERSMGMPSMVSSSEKMPTTKAWSTSSGDKALSSASSSIRRPRTTAV